MRKQALILILPFAIFLIETVSFVPALQDACAVAAVKENNSCIITAETGEKECSNNAADENEESGGDCTEKPDCTTCPVCYTFIFQPRYELSTHEFVFKKHYALFRANYTSSYTSSVWKPPNVSFTHG